MFFETNRMNDMKRILLYRLLILIVISISSVLSYSQEQTDDTKNILILNSYHRGYKSLDAITMAIEENFSNSDIKTNFFFEYFDAKRQVWDEETKVAFCNLLSKKYENTNIDLVITTDDFAYQIVLEEKIEKIKGLPTLFCGVNHYTTEEKRGKDNITGIVEQYDFETNIDFARYVFKEVNTVHIITDNSLSGNLLQTNAKNRLADYQGLNINYISGEDYTTQELKELIGKLPEGDIILLGFWIKDKSGIAKGDIFGNIKEISTASSVPVFELSESGYTYASLGGFVATLHDQGIFTAQAAEKILSGAVKVSEIPVKTNPLSKEFINWNYLNEKWGHLLKDGVKPKNFLIHEIANEHMEHVKLRVPISDLPYTNLKDENGKPLNFGRELLNMIADKNCWEIEPVEMSFPESIEALQKGEIDIIPYFPDEKPVNNLYFDYTDRSIATLETAIIILNNSDIKTIKDLNYKSIGFIRSSQLYAKYNELIKTYHLRYDHKLYSNTLEALHNLKLGKVDAIMASTNVMHAEDYEGLLSIIPGTECYTPVYMVVPKGINARIINKINTDYINMRSELDNDLLSIENKHYKYNLEKGWEQLILTNQERAWLDSIKTIRYFIREAMPMFYKDGDAVSGYLADYFSIISDKLNVSFKPEIMNRDNDLSKIIARLNNGEFQLLPVMIPNNANDSLYITTKPYAELRNVILTRIEVNNIHSYSDMKGKTVGMLSNISHTRSSIAKYPNIEIVQYNEIEEALYALSAGQIDAVVTFLAIASHHLNKNDFVNLKIVGSDGSPAIPICFGVAPENKTFLSIMNKVVKHTPPNLLNKLERKYNPVEVEVTLSIVDKLIYLAILLVILIFVGIIFFVRVQYAKTRILRSEEKLSIIIQSIGDGVIATDAEGKITEMNLVAQQMTGWDIKDARGVYIEEVFNIINQLTGEKVSSPVEKVFATGEVQKLANHTDLISKDNKRYNIADSAAPLFNKDNEIEGVVLTFRDVTDKYAKQAEIDKLAQRYQALFMQDVMPVGVIEAETMLLIEINDAICDLYGYTREELIGMDVTQLSAEPESTKSTFHSLKTNSYRRIHKHKNGERLYMYVSMNYFEENGRRYYFAILHDLTKVIHQKIEIQEKQFIFDSLLKNTNISYWDWDLENNLITFSDNWYIHLGYEPLKTAENMENFLELLDPAFRSEALTLSQKFINKESDIFEADFRMKHQSGPWLWVKVKGLAVLDDDDGKPIRCIGIHIDIHDMKMKELAILEREARFKALFDKNIAGVIIMEPLKDGNSDIYDFKITNCNTCFTQISELSASQMIGNKVTSVFQNLEPIWITTGKEVVEKGNSKSFTSSFNATDKVLDCSIFVLDETQKTICAVISDITEKMKAREELRKNKKQLETTLESIGDGVISTDGKGKIISMNAVARQLTGWAMFKAKGKDLEDVFNIVNQISDEKVESPIEKVIRTGQTKDLANHTDLIANNGTRYHIDYTTSPIKDEFNNILGVVLTFRDVTEKYNQEQEIKDSRFRLNYALQAGEIGFWEHDIESGKQKYDDNFWVVLNMSNKEKQLFKTSTNFITHFLHPEDQAIYYSLVQQIHENSNDTVRMEVRLKVAEEWIWVRISAKIIKRDENNSPTYVVGILQNINESKKQEIKIEKSNRLLTRAQELAKVGHWECDFANNGECDFANNSFTVSDQAIKILGIEKREDSKYSWNDLNNRIINKDRLRERLKEAMAKQIEYTDSYTLRHTHEHRLIEIVSIAEPFFDVSGKLVKYIGVIQDVTESNQRDRELKETYETLRMTMENVELALWDLDINNSTISTNYNWDKLGFVLSGEQISIEEFSSMIYRDDVQIFKDELNKLNDQSIGKINCTIRFQTRKRLVWIHMVGSVNEYNNEKVESVTGIFINVTESKQREEAIRISEENLSFVQKIARIGYIEIDMVNKSEYWNYSTRKILGVDGGTPITPSLMETLIHPDDFKRVIEWLGCTETIKPKINNPSITFRVIKPQGDIVWVKINLVSEFAVDGNLVKLRGFVQDVTSDILRQKELIDAKDAAEAANRSQSVFIANMSHEIRTPLNAILGFSELIERTTNETQTDRYIKSVRTAGNSLLSLINDILEFSRIKAGKFELKPVPTKLIDIANELHTIFWQRAEAKELNFEINYDNNVPTLLLDPATLRQIMINLIGNAIKFTEKGSVIVEIEMYDVASKYADIHFKVTDTGIGIHEEDVANIFGEFQQATVGANKNYEGTGLGLFLSNNFAEMMNGKINVESKFGEGSVFTLILHKVPFVEESDKLLLEDKKSYTDYKFSNSNVLVVDDVINNIEVLQSQLKHVGLTVTAAVSAEEALELLKENQYNLFLLDLRMKEISGDMLAVEIRSLPNYKNTPIICLTASLNPEEQYDLSQFDEIVNKPLTSEILYEVVAKYLPEENIEKTAIEKKDTTPLAIQLDDTIKSKLKSEIKSDIDNISTGFVINEIIAFVNKLEQFNNEHNIEAITNVAKQLKSAANDFNIREIKNIIQLLSNALG